MDHYDRKEMPTTAQLKEHVSEARVNPLAQYWIGMCYFQGHILARDEKKAFRWFNRSAKHECPEGLKTVSAYVFYRVPVSSMIIKEQLRSSGKLLIWRILRRWQTWELCI